MKTLLLLTFLSSMLSILAQAQETQPDHPMVNRAAMWASITARTTDTIYTCHRLANGAIERMAPVSSCSGISLWNGFSVAGGLAGQKAMHHFGWHRFESAPHWVSAAGSLIGIAYTLKHRR